MRRMPHTPALSRHPLTTRGLARTPARTHSHPGFNARACAMACFWDRDDTCQCLHFEGGDDQRLSTADPPKPARATLFVDRVGRGTQHCTSDHSFARVHGSFGTRESVYLWKYHLCSFEDESVRVSTMYRRDICVCRKVNQSGVTAVTPAHDWYHAADPHLSPSQQSLDIRCRDKDCINYYRSPPSFACRVCQFTCWVGA